jgi:hypothetical protein
VSSSAAHLADHQPRRVTSPDGSDSTTEAAAPCAFADTRLRGRLLLAARLTWLVVVLSCVVLFILAYPLRLQELAETFGNLSPAQELVLAELGATGERHRILVAALEVLVPAAFLVTALVIFWKRSEDWVAMLVSAAMVTYVVWITPPLDALQTAQPFWRMPGDLLQALGMALGVTFFYVFPDGRFIPGWTRILVGVQVVWVLMWVLAPGSPPNLLSEPFNVPVLSFVLSMSWWTTGLIAQWYRYVRVATPIQRQQTKWILFGLAAGVGGYLVFGYDRFTMPLLSESRTAGIVYDLVGVPIFLVVMLLIPLSFALSILRYRLWEIDTLINRALVYGGLTALLGGLYTASITLSQRAFMALTGERSDAAIVLTTLIVASAFTPLRAALQSVADKYVKQPPDPRKNLLGFGEQLGAVLDMLEVEPLARRILDEAVRAFNASCGAVYLYRDGHLHVTHTNGDWTQMEGMGAWIEHNGRRFGWLALGPRLNEASYSAEDYAAFQRVCTLVGRAAGIAEGRGLESSVVVAGAAAPFAREAS